MGSPASLPSTRPVTGAEVTGILLATFVTQGLGSTWAFWCLYFFFFGSALTLLLLVFNNGGVSLGRVASLSRPCRQAKVKVWEGVEKGTRGTEEGMDGSVGAQQDSKAGRTGKLTSAEESAERAQLGSCVIA